MKSLQHPTPEQVELWRKANPFQNTGTVWLYDYSRNTVIEKQSDGTNITHISPQGGKRFFCQWNKSNLKMMRNAS